MAAFLIAFATVLFAIHNTGNVDATTAEPPKSERNDIPVLPLQFDPSNRVIHWQVSTLLQGEQWTTTDNYARFGMIASGSVVRRITSLNSEVKEDSLYDFAQGTFTSMVDPAQFPRPDGLEPICRFDGPIQDSLSVEQASMPQFIDIDAMERNGWVPAQHDFFEGRAIAGNMGNREDIIGDSAEATVFEKVENANGRATKLLIGVEGQSGLLLGWAYLIDGEVTNAQEFSAVEVLSQNSLPSSFFSVGALWEAC